MENQDPNNAPDDYAAEEAEGVYQDPDEDDGQDPTGQDQPASNVYITAVNLPAEGEGDENNIFKTYSQEEIENFKCIFDMFDQEKTGFVDVAHLQTILKCLGRDPSEAADLVKDLNPDQSRLSFQEFLVIMRQLENRLVAGQQEEQDQDEEPVEASLEDRNRYGPLLPRTGVHFLPDSKVVDFLK